MYRFEIPRPPPLSALYTNVTGKGRVKTDRYRTWLQAAGWAIQAAPCPAEPIDKPCGLSVIMRRPDKRKRDLDNCFKAVQDLLVQQHIVADDSLFFYIAAWWDDEGPDCVVEVFQKGLMREAVE